GHLAVERRPIGKVADLRLDLLRLVGQIDPVDDHTAGGGQQIGREHAQGCRLAGPVEAQQADDLALFDAERQRTDGPPRTVVLGELLDLDHSGVAYVPTTPRRARLSRHKRATARVAGRRAGGRLETSGPQMGPDRRAQTGWL